MMYKQVAMHGAGFALDEGWLPLHEPVRQLWKWTSVISGLVLAGMACIGLGITMAVMDKPLVWALAGLLVAPLYVAWFWPFADRSFRRWRYRLTNEDLAIANGVYWQTERYVARHRVQHVDITSGPIARSLGLVEVSVFVGGRMGAAVVIPGLSPAEGERLRQTLLRIDPPAEPVAPPILPYPPIPTEPAVPTDAPREPMP